MTEKTANDVVILSAARTATGKFNGALVARSGPELGAAAIRAAIARAGIQPDAIDETIMGMVVPAGAGQAPARQASIFAGIPPTTGALTVNKVCGSGLKSVMIGRNAIIAGEAELIVAGGMESMSNAPFMLPGARQGWRYGHQQVLDANLHDALWDPFEQWAMGNAAEFIAQQFELTRAALDDYAYHSHMKAIDAIDNGRFTAEIAPVEIADRKGRVTVVDTDEGPRRDTNPDVLAKLPPAFASDGIVTAGNAPGLNDGAAAVVIARRSYAEAHGLTPLARIVAQGQAAVEPKWLFDAPAHAMPKVLAKAGWTVADVDLFEINEAFAAQVLANGKRMAEHGMPLDWAKVNVNGGAIALGHPVGASGARVLVTLLHALQQRGLTRGLTALCLGGGEAVSMAVEME